MKTVYYSDPLHDDFAGNHIKTQKVDETFPYINKNRIWKFNAFLLYYIVACPLIFLYCKVLYGMRIKGRRNMAKFKKGGVFIYGNHTHIVDSFIPCIMSYPKRRNYIIASPDAVSIPGLKTIVSMLGAVPIPITISGMRKFMETIENRIRKGSSVTIFPEAHLWPYYTGIRPFKDTSFFYPVNLNVPVIAYCNTYSRRKWLRFIKKPRMTVYLSCPMYPDTALPPKLAQKELRDRVYRFMKDTADKYSDYEYIRYVQVDTEHSFSDSITNNNRRIS